MDRYQRAAAVGSFGRWQWRVMRRPPATLEGRVSQTGIKSIRLLVRRAILRFGVQVATRPRLEAVVKRGLMLFPRLEARLRGVVRGERLSQPFAVQYILRVADLTPHGRKVYSDLENALAGLQ